MRAAKRLLGWSSVKLGVESGTSEGVIHVFERTGRMQPGRYDLQGVDRVAVIRTTLEAAGIEFSEPGGKVRMTG